MIAAMVAFPIQVEVQDKKTPARAIVLGRAEGR